MYGVQSALKKSVAPFPFIAGFATPRHRLRDNHEVADFILRAENGREWRIHKVVLYMHSDVLYRMSTSRNYVEGQIGSVTLKEVSADSIDAMVSYLYDPENFEPWYSGPSDDFASIKHHTDMLIGMWKLADMYNMNHMKDLAKIVFSELFAYENSVEYMELVLDALSELDGPVEFWKAIRSDLNGIITDKHPFEPEDMMRMFNKRPKLAVDMLVDLLNQHYRANYPDP